jgi:hypothetical protein
VAIPEYRTRDGERRIPLADVERAALGEGDSNRKDGDLRYATIGDLIVQALTPRELLADSPHAPQEFESFENLCLQTQATELRGLAVALAATQDEDSFVGDVSNVMVEIPFTLGDATMLITAMARRTEALCELARRLRKARWGDPHFGGGS